MKISEEKLIELLCNSLRSCENKSKDIDLYWKGVIDGQHDLCMELLEQLGFADLIEGHKYVNKPED